MNLEIMILPLMDGSEQAIENVKTVISDTLVGEDVTDQNNIDNKLIELDGTDNKNNLGANAILAVSMASMRASASQQNKQLFEPPKYLRTTFYLFLL